MDCELCGKTFKSMYYVARHMKQVHKVIVGPLKRGPQSERGKFMCHYCGGNWTRKANLKKHLSLVHYQLIPRPPDTKIQCPYDFCGLEFSGARKNLADNVRLHILKEHSVGDVAFIEKHFSTTQDYLEWKANEERIEKVKFIQTRGAMKYSNKIVSHLYCNRSGIPRRRNKSSITKESLKLGKFCPAKITSVTDPDTGVVTVKYFNIHVGHNNDNICNVNPVKNNVIRRIKSKIKKEDLTCDIKFVEEDVTTNHQEFSKEMKAEVLNETEISCDVIFDNNVEIQETDDYQVEIVFENFDTDEPEIEELNELYSHDNESNHSEQGVKI